MRNKLFKLFLSISLLIIVSCSNKITSSEEDNRTTITKAQILSVLESLNKFEVGGEIWDFSTITDLSKFHNYKNNIYNSVQLESSTSGNASVNELIKKLKTEAAPKLDAIGIYFPEDVTTLWGDPNSTRPLHIWFKISIKDGYKADGEIEQLFGKDLMIIFITKGKWVL
ncbi:hypothetical protein [Brachyspira pilosicoli]|uniref:hypothetical protein n=1 Tax=Brachyspira pilosicoli TaxID=52584 RepID=UPI001CA55DC8|nr:hypothetical protein [Brachyspira pilosicoli]MBW5383671.1 hypothetical protein [Brachyspira pilosicoli]